MKIFAVANQKGGVGKTTTTVTLSGILAARGHDVLILDLDPHASVTSYFGFEPETVDAGVYDLFQHVLGMPFDLPSQLVLHTGFEGLHIIPASMAMATLDKQIGNQDGMGLVLAKALSTLQDRFEYVFIDCPPVLGVLMINALAVCQHLLIPVQSEFLALHGLDQMVRTLQMVIKARKSSFAYTVFATMFDKRTRASAEALASMREKHGDYLWDSVIPVDTRLRDASNLHIPPSIHAPDSRGVLAYDSLLNDLLSGQLRSNLQTND